MLQLNLASAERWSSFADELEAASGREVGYRECGTLLVARDDDEAAWAERERALRQRLDLRVERLLGSATRSLEPGLTPSLRGSVSMPDDHSVDPVAVVEALAAACTGAGVQFTYSSVVTYPASIDAERVVLARGAWSGAPVRPVKGQALWLRDPNGPGLCDRVLRWGVPIPGYLVPRGDGRYYLGATAEERGFDSAPTAVAVHEMLRDASEILPGILELEIEELIVGFRPGTPDNMPIIGADPGDPRLVWATGHYRGGVLLAPITAELVVAGLTGATPMLEVEPFSPARFVQVAS
jgi:glycine oxidase